jgi:hypothetical protein
MLHGVAVRAGPGQHERQLERVDVRPVEHEQAVDPSKPVAGRAHSRDGLTEQVLTVALEECSGRIGAGEDGPRRTGRRGGLDARIEAGRVDALGSGQYERRLAPRRQSLVGTGHHHVGPGLERVGWQPGVEAEVRSPGGVDRQRYAVAVGHLGQSRDVANGADVRRIADQHGAHVELVPERAVHRLGRDTERKSGRDVHLGTDPHRCQAGQHQPEQHGAVQGAADDHAVAVAAER